MTRRDVTDSRELLDKVVGVIGSRKVLDLEALEVRDLVGYTDYFVVCSGQSERQVQALAEHLLAEMKKEGILPLGVEGRAGGDWVLVDFNDVVVHVFSEDSRAFYDIEGLWEEAPRVRIPQQPTAAAAAT